jgi:PAS domain S-box-containing protein
MEPRQTLRNPGATLTRAASSLMQKCSSMQFSSNVRAEWRKDTFDMRFGRMGASHMSNDADVGASSPTSSALALRDRQGHVDSVMIVDATGRLVMVNDQAGVLFGYRAQELLHQPLNLLLPERFHEVHDALRDDYAAHPRARQMGSGLKVLGRHHDGHELQLDISLNPLLCAGSLCVLCVIWNVTERRDAERVKEEFVAHAAHALHTPLTALRGYVDMLLIHTRQGQDSPLAEWQHDALEEIQWATERLEALAAALLDVTRIQAGQLEVRPEVHDIVALVRRVVARVRQRGANHPLLVHVPHSSLLATLDPRLIEQTLDHVLNNAMKYSAPGEKIEITVRQRAAQHDALIQVRDHGTGIPADRRERIFTWFGGEDTQAHLAGTGLSLYLCRQFIERHGGQIGVGATRKHGATVWFTLPLATEVMPDAMSDVMVSPTR